MDAPRGFNEDNYDDEAFVGNEEGEIIDGEVLEDLDGGDEDFDDDDDDDEDGDEADAVRRHTQQVEAGDEAGKEEIDEREQLPDVSVQAFRGHCDAVMAVAWQPADSAAAAPGSSGALRLVATGGCDDKAYLWQAGGEGHQELLEDDGATHGDTVAAVAFAAGGSTLATGGMDGAVKLWDAAAGRMKRKFGDFEEAVLWLAWHPQGPFVLAGAEDRLACMYHAEKAECVSVLAGHSGPVTAGGFTPDGKAAVTCGGDGDGSLRTWNPVTGLCTRTIAADGHSFHDDRGIACLAFAPDWAPDAGLVATGGLDSAVVVSNIHTGRPLAKLQGHTASVEALAFSPTQTRQKVLVSAGMDGAAVIWDTVAGIERARCEHPEGVVALSMQARGNLFATACLDGVCRVWDVRTADCVATFGGHSDALQAVAFAPDDEHVLTGGDDSVARVFKLDPAVAHA